MSIDFSAIPVLVIDDEKFARSRLITILKRLGFTSVYEASNCDEASMAVGALKPAIIFCDVHMKPKDGLTFVTELRFSDDIKLRDIPVVMVSSDDRDEAQGIGQQLRVDAYLVKPASVDDVRSSVNKVLGLPTT